MRFKEPSILFMFMFFIAFMIAAAGGVRRCWKGGQELEEEIEVFI